ncbi:uncharacterized protein LOC143525223 isoform X2 [Brachyhypopomus gauderio]|uniref:uncharacterized protein LOC143525223 isoform X2 n=1 Tax=Brachyhypopomus gauderio TaxID=698409 RepID=UPI004040FA30
MDSIIVSLLLLEKNKKLQDDIQRMCCIIEASDACAKQKPQKRLSRIPVALSVIEKKHEAREQSKSLSVAQGAQRVASASGQGTQYSPRPPSSPPTAQASFRQKRAAQLRPGKIGNFQTPQPPCQPRPATQSQVVLRPLQLKKTCSEDISLLDSQSLVNTNFRYLKALPPIGSPTLDVTTIQDDNADVSGIQEYKRKRRPKYNYLGRFQKDPEADGDEQIELKAPRIVCEKPKMSKSKNIRTSEFVTCSHCCCRIPPHVAQIHIPKCAAIRNKSVAQGAQRVASASGQGTQYSPRPPSSPPTAQASFRQKRAAQLRAGKIGNFQTPQPPCQPRPATQSQVVLRPLQLKKTCSEDISLLDSQSLVNTGFRYLKALPPIGSPTLDVPTIQDDNVEEVCAIQEYKRKRRPKYNYLGRFQKDPEADGDEQRELKAPRNVCEKPKVKKVQTKWSKYNYLGRFTKEPGSEDGAIKAERRGSSYCDGDPREESQSVDARPRFTGALPLECGTCGRRFAEHRLEIHAAICSRLHDKKRSMFDSSKHRVKGTDLERYVSRDVRAGMKMSKSKNIRTSEFVTCSHCCCRIPPHVAQIHIPKCAAIRNKPNQGTRR